MAVVRHSLISLGLGDPRMSKISQLKYVIRGIKKATGPRTRLPNNTRPVEDNAKAMVSFVRLEWG